MTSRIYDRIKYLADLELAPDPQGLCQDCPFTFRHKEHQNCNYSYIRKGKGCKGRIPIPLSVISFTNGGICSDCSFRMTDPITGALRLGWERE